MPIVVLTIFMLSRIALPQAGHTSYASAELKDGIFSGSISYNNNDWLAAIAGWYKSDITKSPKNNIEVYERNYFKNYFRLWVDHNQVSLASLDRKEEGDKVVYTFSFNVGDAKEFMIDHRAIFELYPDQTHVMTFRMFGKDRTYTFKPAAPTFFIKK
jgi:uncharacterized protein DUF6702